jgi:rfaE bifunctional protein kinase chain/domain
VEKKVKDLLAERNHFSDIRILVIGDVMLDHYLYGNVERISPEAPVPVVVKSDEKFFLGGAGNVFSNIISLGGKCDLISALGEDQNSSYIKDLVVKHSSGSFLFLDSSRITTVKQRVMSGHHQLLRVDSETTLDIDGSVQSNIIQKVKEIAKKYDCIILSDYNKGVLTPEVIRTVIMECRELNIPVIADPKIKYLDFYSGCTIIKPNFKEFLNLCGTTISPDDLDSIRSYAIKIKDRFRLEAVVITLSDRGIFYLDQNENFMGEAFKIPVSDVSGAGDTVLAVLALCYSIGLEKSVTVDLCNIAGSIACQRVGSACVTLDDLNSHPHLREKYSFKK